MAVFRLINPRVGYADAPAEKVLQPRGSFVTLRPYDTENAARSFPAVAGVTTDAITVPLVLAKHLWRQSSNDFRFPIFLFFFGGF